MDNPRTEVIICKCGTAFAACSVGFQDDEWREEVREWVEVGATIKHMPASKVELGTCDCPKTPEEVRAKNQLSLF